jgi:ribonuclease HI
MNSLNNHFLVYTDGSYLREIKRGGWAFIVISNNRVILTKSGSVNHTSNNRMELLSAIEALKILDPTSLSIFSDSEYLIKGVTLYLPHWIIKNRLNPERKSCVKNEDLWLLLNYYLGKHDSIDWNWVKSHSSDQWNQLADQFALEAGKYGMKN